MQPLDINVLHNTSIPLRYLLIQIIHYLFYCLVSTLTLLHFREINEISMKNSNKNLHLVLFYSVNSSGVQIVHSWFNLLKMLCPLGTFVFN